MSTANMINRLIAWGAVALIVLSAREHVLAGEALAPRTFARHDRTRLVHSMLSQGIYTHDRGLVAAVFADSVEIDNALRSRNEAAAELLASCTAHREVLQVVSKDMEPTILVVSKAEAERLQKLLHDEPARLAPLVTKSAKSQDPSDDWAPALIIETTSQFTNEAGMVRLDIVEIRTSYGWISVDSLAAEGMNFRTYAAQSTAAGLPDVTGYNQDKSPQGLSGQTFIHRPANVLSPTIQRITRSLARDQFSGKSVFSWHGNGATAQSHTGLGSNNRGVLYMADRAWDHIGYGELEGSNSWVKSFGQDEPVEQHNLRNVTGLAANNGWGEPGNVAYAFVAESHNSSRISRLSYSFPDRVLSYDDSLSRDDDDLSYITDITLNDGGTRENPQDDWVWVCDKKGQLTKYNCFGAGGPQLRYDGVSAQSLYHPIAIACGRNGQTGVHNNLVFVVDRYDRTLKRFEEQGGTLILSGEIDLSQYSGDLTSSMIVDSWGNVCLGLSAPDDRNSRLLKFLPSLEFLATHSVSPSGDDGIYRLMDLSNPLGTDDFIGYGDLFVTEAWDDNSGGQWFYLGVELTSGAASPWPNPYSDFVRLSYTATDGHWGFLKVWRWDPDPGEWALVQQSSAWDDVPPGLTQADIQLVDEGIGCLYQIEVLYQSAYVNWLGNPVNAGSLSLYVNKCTCGCNPFTNLGDCNGDNIKTIVDVLWMIDYVISDGPPPQFIANCEQNGDWNCDGLINLLDVVATADAAFRKGPSPCDPCDCSPYPSDCPDWPQEPQAAK